MIQIKRTWYMHLMVDIALLIAFGLVGYGFLTGERLYSVQSPLLNTIGEIEREASRIKLWMDDVLAGHEQYEEDKLRWSHIEQSISYLESLIHGYEIWVLDLSNISNREISNQIEKLNSQIGRMEIHFVEVLPPAVRIHSTSQSAGRDFRIFFRLLRESF